MQDVGVTDPELAVAMTNPCLNSGSAMIGLDHDILFEIFRFVDPKDLMQCRQVCRRFRDVVDEEGHLQHILQLFAAGHVERHVSLGSPSGVALHERRDYLQRHLQARRFSRLAWRPVSSLKWRDVAVFFQAPGGPYCFYTGNALVTSMGRVQNQPHLRDTVRCMRFSPLHGGEVAVTSWARKFDHPFSSIGVDCDRDLLVLVRDHFYNDVETMIDGVRLGVRPYMLSPTDDASEPKEIFVDIPMTRRVDGVHTAVQLHGDTIAIIVMPATRVDLGYSAVSFAHQVVFINRPTFTPFARFKFPGSEWMPPFESPRRKDYMELNGNFLLLDDHTFINLCLPNAATRTDYAIDLYVLGSGDTAQPERVARFHLPTRAQDRWLSEWAGRMQSTAWPVYQRGNTPTTLEVLPSMSLLIVNHSFFRRVADMSSILKKDPLPSYLHLCYIIRILPFIKAAEAYRAGHRYHPDIPWSHWGPKNSRTIHRPNYLVGNGCRVLIVNGEEQRVWDFNIVTAAQEAAQHQAADEPKVSLPQGSPKSRNSWWRRKSSSSTHSRSNSSSESRSVKFVGADRPTAIPQGAFLASDIVGSLPYYETFVSPVPWGKDAPCRAILHGSPLITVVEHREKGDNEPQRKLYAFDL